MLALFAFSSAKTERWTLGITIYACCLQVWTEPKSPCGSVPRTCPRVTQHYFFVFADCFEGGKKATLGEFNTLGISSKTFICHLVTVRPIAKAVAPKFSTCERRRIRDSSLIHVKKCVVVFYGLAIPLIEGENQAF